MEHSRTYKQFPNSCQKHEDNTVKNPAEFWYADTVFFWKYYMQHFRANAYWPFPLLVALKFGVPGTIHS